ncbi:MAG: Ig-like domain-containing protein [Candidatus Neomarinimicrobiota bacterium]
MRWIRSGSIAGVIIALVGCAAQGPPGGGPVDVIGPQLVSVVPENGSIRVALKPKIELTFSETINPRTAEGTLIVSPRLKTTPVIKTTRKKVSIGLLEPLQANTTYIFSYARNLQDYQKNPTSDDVKLAFSTGDSLDEGKISGTVYQIPEKKATMIWVFRKQTAFPDSLPGQKPDYAAAVTGAGSYEISNLPVGEYRLIAHIPPAAKPGTFFLSEEDPLGVQQTENIVIRHRRDAVTGIDFRLDKMSLRPFRLLTAVPANNSLELNFTRSVPDTNLKDATFRIVGAGTPNVLKTWTDAGSPKEVFLQVDGLKPDTTYSIDIQNLRDETGDDLKPGKSPVEFSWRAQTDTLKPRLANTKPLNRGKNFGLSESIVLNFSEPVILDSIRQKILLLERDSVNVPITDSWLDGNSLILTPKDPLKSASNYTLIFLSQKWKDAAGNFFKDSVITQTFGAVDINQFGSVSGVVKTDTTIDFRKLIVAVQLSTENFQRQTHPDSTGKFAFPSLLPGKYSARIWFDRNGNEAYDAGQIIPYQIAEPYKDLPNAITIRSRWETAEVELKY